MDDHSQQCLDCGKLFWSMWGEVICSSCEEDMNIDHLEEDMDSAEHNQGVEAIREKYPWLHKPKKEERVKAVKRSHIILATPAVPAAAAAGLQAANFVVPLHEPAPADELNQIVDELDEENKIIKRKQAAIKAWETRRKNAAKKKRSEAAKKGWEKRKAEAKKRSEAAKKAWETRKKTKKPAAAKAEIRKKKSKKKKPSQ
jgi:hypothetical protein